MRIRSLYNSPDEQSTRFSHLVLEHTLIDFSNDLLLGSHTMPNMLPAYLALIFAWGGLPVVISAFISSRLGRTKFAWNQLGWGLAGSLVGLVVLPTVTLLAVLVISPLLLGPSSLILVLIIGVVCAAASACLVARRARPKPVVPRLDEVQMQLARVEEIVGRKLRESDFSNGTKSILDAAMDAGFLTLDDRYEWTAIRDSLERFQRAPSVMHEDVAHLIRRAENLAELLSNSDAHRPKVSPLPEDGNPYRPVAD